ncbi:50S ribosomal protein L3 [Candidatus Woesebacteria bacterium RIFCSPHIGHO2_01_FULL_44_21]|uniref:Large ribosomal subunit protein uL3 n=1 Tax=Candidatus Woesebacteria bacterium RIFCSPHIGHO2_01_FULL_44_21 TaxID=1802503 RepID=A0A1F7Z1L6_9BACT|nr:MAG: 50S ribosomal protein L3 [Candidatus Woesebacteria bacterium RIFCSPHIGHO2_01_FULL_44_21]OGM71488.1 MAG: 50S ribosomal protein L3 [Candidatus Woesebacteria bacterium RIFCSPLOWO2_01_FULL_44_24b]
MIDTILGTKQKMSQAFVENTRVPVTVISVEPNIVTQVLSESKNGYWGVQLGTGAKKTKNMTKSVLGHLKKAGSPSEAERRGARFLREIRLTSEPEEKVGDTIKVSDIFSAGDVVRVTGVSKGKGFAGGVKRWHFAGGPKTHGQSDRLRAPGSIGQGTDPGRVWKGKKMAGRMGGDTVSIKNIKVVAVDAEKNELHLSGPVPGTPESLLIIKRIGRPNES